jgi:DNA-binding NtrC family response regulator
VEAFPEVVTMFPPRADSVEAGTAGLEGTDEAADVAIQCTLQLARDAMRRDLPIYETLAELERRILASAIQRHRGNMSQVCHALRLPRSTLMLKRRQYGLP